MDQCLTFKCCFAGTENKSFVVDGKPLVICMESADIHAFPVTAGDSYTAGQIVDFNGVKAIALFTHTVVTTGTLAFLLSGQVNKDLLLKANGTTAADQADFDAIMPAINPVAVSS